MRGVVMHAPGDVRVEDCDDPIIIAPTDEPTATMGHEYVGIVEQAGSEVQNITPGQFVVGSFFASDNTCESCQAGYHSSCIHRWAWGDDVDHFQRKCTKSRPKLFESFSTRWY